MGNKTMPLRDAFIEWVTDELQLKESTANSYCSYVTSVNKSFSEHKILKTALFDLLQE
jgi:hypothetical protein